MDEPAPKRSKKGSGRRGGRGGGPRINSGPEGSRLLTPLAPNSEILAVQEGRVRFSKVSKAPQVTLSEDRMTASSRKGYRMARATHGAHEGTWFFEVTVAHLGATGHARLGWATDAAELQAPVGFDQRGYGYRDLEGSKVHHTLREPYGEPYRENDVIGCWLHLPPGGRPFTKTVADVRTYRNNLYVTADEPGAPQPGPLRGAAVAFLRNGALQGIAYRDVLEGNYHPAVSLYTDLAQKQPASVSCNFGPCFKHGIPDVEGFPAARPASDMAAPPEAAAAATAASSAAARPGGGGGGANGTASGTASAAAGSTAPPSAAASAGEAAGVGAGQQGAPPPQPEEGLEGGTELQTPAGLTLQDVLRQDFRPDAAALLEPYPSGTQ